MLALLLLVACDHASVDRSDVAERRDSAEQAQAAIDPRTLPPPGAPPNPVGFDADSAVAAADAAVPERFPEVRYSRLYIANRAMRDSIHRVFARKDETMSAYRALTTLNRCELGYIGVGDTIVVPDTIIDDLRAYSVFPLRYEGAENVRKLIVVTNAYQAYACYEYGRLVRFAAANTGRESKATFPGRYALNWKERMRVSSLNDDWKLPYNWNFHLYAGNAFHQFTMPGRPVSHSCVRQFRDDAEWLFSWGEAGVRNAAGRVVPMTGTPVLIIDMFDFTRKTYGPWLDLASNRDVVLQLPEKPMEVEEALIPISQVPHGARGALADRERYETAEEILRQRGVIREGVHLSPSINYNKQREERAARRSAAASRARPESGQQEPAPSEEPTTQPKPPAQQRPASPEESAPQQKQAPQSKPSSPPPPEVKNLPPPSGD